MNIKVLLIVTAIALSFVGGEACAYDDNITHNQLTEHAIRNSSVDDYFRIHLGLPEGRETIYHLSIPTFKENDARNSDGWRLRQIIQEGSRMEDTPNCRASNHFHNPLKAWADAGLTDTHPVTDALCHNWNGALDGVYYSNLTWATNFLSPSQRTALEVIEYDAADGVAIPRKMDIYTWGAARGLFYNWLTGNAAMQRRESAGRALYTLGHVLHLLEDMGVPAHVRNEPPAREEA
jgi:hypothetical protein